MKSVPQAHRWTMALNRARSTVPALPDRWFPFLLLAPALSVLFLILIYPLAYSFRLSLHSYDLIMPMQFVGVRNYERVLTDPRVWHSIRTTFALAIPAFVLQLTIGFGLALLIHHKAVAKGFWRALFALPLLLTPVVVGINWRVMLNYDFGVINHYLTQLGLPRQNWVYDATWAMPSLIIVEVWHTTSFVTLVTAAGLASLPEDLFEAAKVDGATFWQELWSITIPLLKPLFLVIALFRSYELLRIFDIVFTLTQGGPGRATETLSFHIFSRTFEGWQLGYSASISYVLFFISGIISLTLIRLIGTSGTQEVSR